MCLVQPLDQFSNLYPVHGNIFLLGEHKKEGYFILSWVHIFLPVRRPQDQSICSALSSTVFEKNTMQGRGNMLTQPNPGRNHTQHWGRIAGQTPPYPAVASVQQGSMLNSRHWSEKTTWPKSATSQAHLCSTQVPPPASLQSPSWNRTRNPLHCPCLLS